MISNPTDGISAAATSVGSTPPPPPPLSPSGSASGGASSGGTSSEVAAQQLYFEHARRSAHWLLCALICAALGVGALHAHALSAPLFVLFFLANGLVFTMWPRNRVSEDAREEAAKVIGVTAGARMVPASAVVAAVAAELVAVPSSPESEDEDVGAAAAALPPPRSSGGSGPLSHLDVAGVFVFVPLHLISCESSLQFDSLPLPY